MSDMYNIVGFILGSVGIVVIPILLLLVFVPWLVTAIQVFKLAKDVGYEHPGFAFIPIGCIQQMVLCNSLGGISGSGPGATVVSIIAILTCAVVTGFIPIIGQILAVLSFVFVFIMFVFTVIHVVAFCKYNDRGWVGPLLCYILIPFFGCAIMCAMLRKSL